MRLIPAVDLKSGKAVRLYEGDPARETPYGDPVEAALRFQEEGATLLHLVDLDRALGTGENREVVRRVAASSPSPSSSRGASGASGPCRRPSPWGRAGRWWARWP